MTATCGLCARLQAWAKRENPHFIAEFRHSLWFVGDHQFYKGYSVLVYKEHVSQLHELPTSLQHHLSDELMTATQVLLKLFEPWRMNYQIYGNRDEHLAWHLIPRYKSDVHHLKPPGFGGVNFDDHKIDAALARQIAAQCQNELKNAKLK